MEREIKVTFKKMERVGFDQAQYDKFVANHVRCFMRQGQTKEEAQESAESICSMYKHHFRIYK